MRSPAGKQQLDNNSQSQTSSTRQRIFRVAAWHNEQFASMPLITDLRPKGWQFLAELPLAQPEQLEALLALQTDGLPDLDRRGQSAFLIARLSYHLALALAASWLQERCAPRLHAKNVALQPVEPASANGSRRRWPGLYLGDAEVDLPPGDQRAKRQWLAGGNARPASGASLRGSDRSSRGGDQVVAGRPVASGRRSVAMGFLGWAGSSDVWKRASGRHSRS